MSDSTAAKLDILIDIQAKIGDLLKTQQGFREAKKEGESLGTLLKSGLGIGSGMELARRGIEMFKATITDTVREALRMAGALKDQSEALGVTTTELQVLSLEFKAAGADAGRLTEAISTQTRGLADARDLSSAAAAAYHKLGLNAAEVEKLPIAERLIAVARAAKNHTDQTVALNAASEILGSRGLLMTLAALENLGTKGVAAMTRFHEEAGEIMSSDTITRLDRATKSWERFWNSMVIGSGEALSAIDRLIESWKNAPWQTIAATIAAGTPGGVAALIATVAANSAPPATTEGATAGKPGGTFDSAKMKAAAEAAKALADARKAAAETVTESVLTPYEKYNRTLTQLNDLHLSGAITTDIYRRANKLAADDLAAALVPAQSLIDKLKEQGIVLHESLFTPMETYNAEVRELDKLQAAGAITAEDYARALDRTVQKLHDATALQPVTAALPPPKRASGLYEGLDAWRDQAGTSGEQVASAAFGAASNSVSILTDGIVGLIEKTRTWGDIGRSAGQMFLTTLVQLGLQMAANAAISSVFDAKEKAQTTSNIALKGAEGGFKSIAQLGPIFGPLAFAASIAAIMGILGGFRERGGPVSAGVPYVVGEKRAEIFVPGQSGMILPSTETFARSAPGLGASSPVSAQKQRVIVAMVNTQEQYDEIRRLPGYEVDHVDIVHRNRGTLLG